VPKRECLAHGCPRKALFKGILRFWLCRGFLLGSQPESSPQGAERSLETTVSEEPLLSSAIRYHLFLLSDTHC